ISSSFLIQPFFSLSYMFNCIFLRLGFFILFLYTTLFRSSPRWKTRYGWQKPPSPRAGPASGPPPPADPPRAGGRTTAPPPGPRRSEEHTSELQSRENIVCRLLLEKKNSI